MDLQVEYDREATTKLARIKQLEFIILTITFIVLFFEALFIFVPAERELSRTFLAYRKNEELLENLASYDEMTKLYNKRVGLVLLHQEFEKNKRNQSPLTLCFIDADSLKSINDN